MKIARTAAELQNLLPTDAVSALIPTMGGLHEGHLSLVRKARKIADYAVVSIYVNPLQFGPNEDFGEYPRDLADDCEKLRDLADVVFAPDDAEIYPTTQSVRFSLPPIADELCGASRPGFFHGVATVVGKLFNMVRPSLAIFGEKDYQQAHIIKIMTQQMNFPVQIVLSPTIREADGLAMSSRNNYLSADERRIAPLLAKTLANAAATLQKTVADVICRQSKEKLTAAGFALDYFELRDAETLSAVAGQKAVLLAAANLGKTRLIDNIKVDLPD